MKIELLGLALTGSLALCLSASGATSAAVADTSSLVVPFTKPISCADARFDLGINIPDDRDIESGDIRTVDAIVSDGDRTVVGYRYTLNDGRTYVADRARASLTLDALTRMNDLVNRMSKFEYNAFDSRDDGYSVYPVKWNTDIARQLGVSVIPCLRKRNNP